MRQDVNVCAIIVTYHPDADKLAELLRCLQPQVDRIIIVDNGSAPFPVKPGVDVLRMERNLGVGAAQNVGIAAAGDARFVLLMDDDSVPSPDMVQRLLDAYTGLTSRGVAVAALGANYFELNAWQWLVEGDKPLVPIETLGSSGCLIPMSVFKSAGPLDEQLFVDYVDFEWCLRASRFGKLFIVAEAKMTHTLGEQYVRYRGRRVYYGGVARLYFIFRNATHLYLRPGLPLRWKIADARTRLLMLSAAIAGAFPAPRRQTLAHIFRGILDGLRGRLGPGRFLGRR